MIALNLCLQKAAGSLQPPDDALSEKGGLKLHIASDFKLRRTSADKRTLLLR